MNPYSQTNHNVYQIKQTLPFQIELFLDRTQLTNHPLNNQQPLRSLFHHNKYNRAVTVANECVARNTTILTINETVHDVCKHFENFEMLEYPISHPTNPPNHKNSLTVPSDIRPFGAWYKHGKLSFFL